MSLSPFHRDELAAQSLAGRSANGAGIRTFMPDQHREFFALLPYLFVAAADAEGWPVASVLTGSTGFVQSPRSRDPDGGGATAIRRSGRSQHRPRPRSRFARPRPHDPPP